MLLTQDWRIETKQCGEWRELKPRFNWTLENHTFVSPRLWVDDREVTEGWRVFLDEQLYLSYPIDLVTEKGLIA